MSKEIISKTKRIADILEKFQDGFVELPGLSGSLGVNLRTIQRDIRFIKEIVPIFSPKQGIYAFAEGFSLNNAGLTAQKAAVLVISYEIAAQTQFKDVIKDIEDIFIPKSFEECNFYPTEKQIESQGEIAVNMAKAINTCCSVKMRLKDTDKIITIRPYKLLSLMEKWCFACADSHSHISLYYIDNIKHFVLGTSFRRRSPIIWKIWSYAKQSIEEFTKNQPADIIPAQSYSFIFTDKIKVLLLPAPKLENQSNNSQKDEIPSKINQKTEKISKLR
jgi:predicted DNA-binding transcriptional regulator YafY